MNRKEYKQWNEQGIIPGPEEEEEQFIQRAYYCLQLESQLSQQVGAELPFEIGDLASKMILLEANQKMAKLYGIAPAWVPLFFSNYQLAPWHGGCAWIFQLNQETPTAAFLQLRARFRTHTSYLGLYRRHELITHEIAHVGRMMYQEPQFEEFLAYYTSDSTWRRWLGPIIQSPKESLLFILTLGVVIMADLALIAINDTSYRPLMGLKWIPILLVILALIRLSLRQFQFHRCLKNLDALYQNRQIAQAILYRLTDKEIRLFTFFSTEKIKKFIQKDNSFRWRFLKEIYPVG